MPIRRKGHVGDVPFSRGEPSGERNRRRHRADVPLQCFSVVRRGVTTIPVACLNSLQKGDLLTTETTEITETKDNFIFH